MQGVVLGSTGPDVLPGKLALLRKLPFTWQSVFRRTSPWEAGVVQGQHLLLHARSVRICADCPGTQHCWLEHVASTHPCGNVSRPSVLLGVAESLVLGIL